MSSFDDFMRKAKAGELRGWLLLDELADHLDVHPSCPLYFVVHSPKTSTIAMVDSRTTMGDIVRDDAGRIKDVNLACWLDTKDGGRFHVVEASLFQPDHSTVSRVFTSEAQRNLYYSELASLNEAMRESQSSLAVETLRRLVKRDPKPPGGEDDLA